MDLEELKKQRKVLGSQCDVLDTKIKMGQQMEQLNNFDIVKVAAYFTDGGTLAFTLNNSSEVERIKTVLLEILTERIKK